MLSRRAIPQSLCLPATFVSTPLNTSSLAWGSSLPCVVRFLVGHLLETAELHFTSRSPFTLFLSRMGDANHRFNHAALVTCYIIKRNRLIASIVFFGEIYIACAHSACISSRRSGFKQYVYPFRSRSRAVLSWLWIGQGYKSYDILGRSIQVLSQLHQSHHRPPGPTF